MTDEEAIYKATVDGSSYSVELPPAADYNTVATTNNGMTTKNRVYVGTTDQSGEEVYFVSGDTTVTYDYDDIPSLVTSGSFAVESGKTHSTGSSAVLTVPVSTNSKITVTGYYKYSYYFDSNSGDVKTNTSNSTSSTTSETYTSSSDVTITITGTSYLTQITVEPVTDTTYYSEISVPGDYSTLTKAISAIKNMDRSEGQIVTINLTDDIQEQVLVDADYVTINGNGHTISWYYGMVGSYYSVGSDGLYDEELFRDKYETVNVWETSGKSFWGGVVIVTGNHFYAYDLTMKNTFNYEVTSKEIEDGVVQHTLSGTTSTGTLDRVSGTDVELYTYKERANALAISGDYAELYNCNILSSQDTLGWNGELSTHIYFKDCTIGGNVDYICGAGNMIFDDCTLQWKTYTDTSGLRNSSVGFIVAPKTNPYIFRNCTVTADSTSTSSGSISGAFGRTWGTYSTAYFINTETNGYIGNAWGEMNSGDLDTAAFYEYYNTNGTNQVQMTNATQLTDDQYIALDVSSYLGGWTPVNYIEAVVDVEGAVVDDDGDIIVYGYIPTGAVDGNDFVGFTLSTATPFFDQGSLTTDTVYEKVTYEKDSSTQTISSEENYVVAVVLKNDSTAAGTLYVRGINGTSDSTVYNDIATVSFAAGSESGSTEAE